MTLILTPRKWALYADLDTRIGVIHADPDTLTYRDYKKSLPIEENRLPCEAASPYRFATFIHSGEISQMVSKQAALQQVRLERPGKMPFGRFQSSTGNAVITKLGTRDLKNVVIGKMSPPIGLGNIVFASCQSQPFQQRCLDGMIRHRPPSNGRPGGGLAWWPSSSADADPSSLAVGPRKKHVSL